MKKKPKKSATNPVRSKSRANDDMRDEYDFNGSERGRYAERYAKGTNVVVLSPELMEFFPDSKSVNKALRNLVEIARKNVKMARVS